MKINDIDLKQWKEHSDILTDSLWIFQRRDNSGVHSSKYWGNFIPQIPYQLLKRYTKKGDWVLDPFMGSGTTLIEAQRLERNCIGIDIKEELKTYVSQLVQEEKTDFFLSASNSQSRILLGDSGKIDIQNELRKIGIEKVQFVLLHPPYFDIIKFSNNEEDLSNQNTVADFVHKFIQVIKNTIQVLEDNRFFAIVIGDKYDMGKWIPLGFYLMDAVSKQGHILKSIIVKNYEETVAKKNQKSLWRYRALAGGFYIFKHEYIFLFKKK